MTITSSKIKEVKYQLLDSHKIFHKKKEICIHRKGTVERRTVLTYIIKLLHPPNNSCLTVDFVLQNYQITIVLFMVKTSLQIKVVILIVNYKNLNKFLYMF